MNRRTTTHPLHGAIPDVVCRSLLRLKLIYMVILILGRLRRLSRKLLQFDCSDPQVTINDCGLFFLHRRELQNTGWRDRDHVRLCVKIDFQ